MKRRTVQGRLKVCTRGLFFVPNDLISAILRFPFRFMPELPCIEQMQRAEDVNRDEPECFLAFRCSTIIEMRERGIDHPYNHKKAMDPETNEPLKFRFTLSYSPVSKLISSVQAIYKVARMPKRSMNKVEEEKLLAPVLSPRLFVDFDASLLVDYREQFLLMPGRLVTRIEPLLNYPGSIVLTDQR